MSDNLSPNSATVAVFGAGDYSLQCGQGFRTKERFAKNFSSAHFDKRSENFSTCDQTQMFCNRDFLRLIPKKNNAGKSFASDFMSDFTPSRQYVHGRRSWPCDPKQYQTVAGYTLHCTMRVLITRLCFCPAYSDAYIEFGFVLMTSAYSQYLKDS